MLSTAHADFRTYKYDTCPHQNLGPSINGLVTDRNTKLCCRGFLALFQSATANTIDSEHTRVYKRLLPVCEAEILRVTVEKLKFSHLFKLIFDDFRLKVPQIAEKGHLCFLLMFIKTDNLSMNMKIQS